MPRGSRRGPKRVELGSEEEVAGPSEAESEPLEEQPSERLAPVAQSYAIQLLEVELVENQGVGDEWLLTAVVSGRETKLELAELPQLLYSGPAQDLEIVFRAVERDAAQDDVGEATFHLAPPWEMGAAELEIVVYEDGEEGETVARWRLRVEVLQSQTDESSDAGSASSETDQPPGEAEGLVGSWLGTYTLPPLGFTLIGAGDLDGDGFADLLAASPRSTLVSLFVGQGDGRFEPVGEVGIGVVPERLLVADFNGDALGDIVAVTWADRNAKLLLSRGQFQLAPPISIGIPYGAWDVQVGQLNDHLGWELVWFTQRGPVVWSFTRQGQVMEWMSPPAGLSFVMLVPSPYVWTDVDADQSLDLVYYSHNPGELYLRWNGGTDLPIGFTPNQVPLHHLVAADVDGDGVPDILGLGNQGEIYIWRLNAP